ATLAEQLALLRARSGDVCELWLSGCAGWAARVLYRRAPDCHRTRYQLAGLLDVCAICAVQARCRRLVDGLVVCHRPELPTVPLRYRGCLAHLDDAGGVHPLDPLYLPDSW